MIKAYKNQDEPGSQPYFQTSMREDTYKTVLTELLQLDSSLTEGNLVCGDVGCGLSRVPKMIPGNWNYIGTTMRLSEAEILTQHGIVNYVDDIADTKLEDIFDINICVHTLPYVSDQFNAIHNLVKMTKNGGYLAIVYHFKVEGTPDYSEYFYFLSHFGMNKILRMMGTTLLVDKDLGRDGHLLIVKVNK